MWNGCYSLEHARPCAGRVTAFCWLEGMTCFWPTRAPCWRPGQFSPVPLAECAMIFMLMLARRWHEAQASFHQGRFYTPMGRELEGARLLLIGFGASAKTVAARARPFGLCVPAVDVREISEVERREFDLQVVGKPAGIDRLLPESDYVLLHLHLNAQTRHITDARRHCLLKPTACLVNVARGPLVDEETLSQQLAEGRLGGAGLDVFASEPVDPNKPLFRLPCVIASRTSRGKPTALPAAAHEA